MQLLKHFLLMEFRIHWTWKYGNILQILIHFKDIDIQKHESKSI